MELLRDNVPISRVDELSSYAKDVPSETADWAGMTSHTRLVIRDEYIFDECGIAVVGDQFDHNYQVITSARIHNFRQMQTDVGWFDETDEYNAENIVADTDDGREKYTLHGRIRALLHTIVNDGRKHGDPTADEITVEYTKHDSLDDYIVLIKW